METKETNENGEMMVCPNCMTQNSPMTEFCKSCGYPIGQYVTVDPINRILSQGWLYRKAVSGRITVFGFWGMWIVFGSAILYMLISLLLLGRTDTDGGIISGLWPFGLIIIVYIAILYRVTKNYLKIKRKTSEAEANDAKNTEDEWVCTKCNATVEKNATICPNCGKDVNEIEED
jgi:ribosomal protein L40E